MAKLVLNGCQLSLNECGRLTSTVDLSTCSGGGGGTGGSGDTINSLSINGCVLSIAYTDANGAAQTKSVDISSCEPDTGDTITDLVIDNCNLTLSYTDKDGVAKTKVVDLSACAEVEIQGCNNITVTGSGSSADPYIICGLTSVTDITGFTWNSTTGNTVITFTKSDGTTGLVNTTILPTFVNTDNQQLTGDNTGTVLLTLTPVPQPDGSTNYTIKADLKVAATTPSGGTNGLKLDASGNYYVDIPNGSETKVTGCAGTTVTGSGTTADPYVICASVANGSETKVQAGTNTTVTGTGTAADPYIINATGGGATPDGSETKLIAGKNTTVTGTGTAADPYIVNADLSKLGSTILVNRTSTYAASGRSLTQYPFNNAPAARRLGDTSLMTLSGGGVLLQPGYRYRVTTRLQVYTAVGANSWTGYVLKLGGTSIDASLYMKHNGFEAADNANGQQYSMYDVVEIPAGGSAQLLTLVNLDGTTASTWTFESLSSMLVEVVGIL